MDATASAQVERQSAVGSKAPSEIGAGGKQKKGDQTKLVQGLKVVYDKISQKGISSRSKDSKAKSEEPPTRDAKAKDDGSDGGQLVDIVAVPGLGADPKWSWIKREKINSKPSDKTDPGNAETEKFKEGPSCIEDKLMLQAEVPNSRIMVFHYASQWWGEGAVSQRLEQVADNLVQALKNKRKECPRRPILFIGHSLGGVIIEKVVCRAKLRGNDFHDVYSSIAGCVFLGTPFTGSASQAKAACVAKGGEFLGKATYNSLLKLMENDGDHLKALLEDFLLLVDEAGIQTHCFFELQESNLTKFISSISFLSWAKCSELIAGFDTATLQGRPKTSLNLDHFNLNKFGSPRDEHWIAIHCEIKKMANKAYKIVKGRQNALPEKLDDSKFQEIMEALTLGESAPEKDISRVAKERRDAIHATAKLVLGNEKIQEWLADEEQGLLWISTQPGMDTAMMSVAIQRKLLEIKKDIGSDKAEAHICYFFCNDTDTKKNNTLSILKALVKQLIAQTKKLALHLPLEQKSQSARISYDTVFDLAPPFQAMLRDDSIGTVYILINSLHEVDEDSRRDLLALIDDSLPLSEDGARIEGKVTVKWICVGINRPDIEQTMRKAEHITPEDIGSSKELQNALKSLVRDRVVDLAEKLKYRKDLVFWLRTEITERAEGNATWVDLACGEIQSVSPKPINVRSFVEQLRQGLTPLYKQIQRRVLHTDYQDLEHTKEILRTMMIVVHHPTLEELAILADLPEEARNDSKKIKPYIARCGSFLRIKKDQMNKKLSRVEFMDTSAKNYLKENAAEVLGLSKKLLTQHGILALRCLIYLQEHPQANTPLEEDEEDDDDDDDDDSDSDSDSEDEDEDGEESDNKDKGTAENDKGAAEIDRVHAEDENAAKTENLYRGNIAVTYPSKFWIDHAKAATSDVVEDFGLDQIFWNDETMSQMPWWPRLTELTKEYPNLTKLTPMHLAAFFDFRPLLQELLSEWSKHKDQIRAQDSIGREPLYWAAREGHLESVMLLVKHGADVSATSHNNKTGVTVLHGAVEGGCVDVVKFLVKNGAIVDVPNKRLGTALCTAAAKGHTDVVKYLLDAGAKLDAPAGYPYGNAVGAACSRGNTEIVQLLVDNGCSVNVRNEDKKYPLVKAIEAEILELVSLFLSHDANVESRQEALDVAARRNYPEAVELLIKNSTDLNINDAFLQAVTYGNHELFQYFAHDHLDPKVLEKALYTASHMEEEETVKILLGMKADPNAQGEEYGNALQAAAYDGSVGIVRLLLEAGANPNMVGGDYGTALQAAAFQGDTDNIGLLLDAGAETNAGPVGMFGNALYAAVVGNNKQAAELLLDRGANVNAHGGDLGFALLAATDEAHLDIMEMLLLHGADANARTEDGVTPLILAASTLPMAALKTLLDHGANINAADENGVTALIAVADTGDTESTELLLERGANVNTMEPNRGSALQIAASNGDEESCEVLLKYGASVNILGGKYQTALQAGAYGGHLDLVETLLDRGAETSITGGFYGSALNAAASTDNTDIINILIETADDSMRDEALHYAVHYKQREAAELLLTNNANVLTTKKWGSILQALEKPITEDEENSDDETDDSDEDEDDDDMDDDDDDDEESDWWGDDDEDEDEDEEGLPANDDLVKSSVKPAFLETEDQDKEGHQWKGVAIGEEEEGELHGEKYGDSDGDGGGMDEEKGKASSDTEPDGENLGHADSVVEDEEQNIQDLRDILEKAIDEAGGLPSAPIRDGSTARFALNKRPVGSTVPPPPSATKSEMDDATSQGTSDTVGENQPVLPSQPLDASNANGSTPSISRTSLSYSFDGASSTPAQPPEPRTLTADDQLQNTSIIGAWSPQRALGGLFQPSDTSLDAAQPDPTSNAELTSKRSRFKNMMGKTARQSANLIRSDETKEMFSKTVGIFKDKTKNMNKIFGAHGPDRDVLDEDGLDEDE